MPDLDRPEHRPQGIPGSIPGLIAPPGGCRFHPRCPTATDRCRAEKPLPRAILPGRAVACHHAVP